MKVLHTSDWHAGKRLGRTITRTGELTATIRQMVDLVEEHRIDLVLAAGDLFDKQTNIPAETVGLVLDGLIDLAHDTRVPVVAVSGNHDPADWFEHMARTLTPHRVHMIGSVRPHPRSWITHRADVPLVTVTTRNGQDAVVAAVPFIREQQLFDAFDITPGTERGAYAENMRQVCARYSEAAIEEAQHRDGRSFLMGHFLISGARVLGGGMPRGERPLDMSDTYATLPQTVDTGVDYVALGHVHNPQSLPGLYSPGEYSGSPIQMDFGERDETKRAVIYDTETRTVTSVLLTGGIPLAKVEHKWGTPPAEETLECYVDATVTPTGGVSNTEIREWATRTWPRLVRVQTPTGHHPANNAVPSPDVPTPAPNVTMTSVADQYRGYWETTRGEQPPETVLAAVRRLETETEPA